MSSIPLFVIVLAAGKGSRMKSQLPKVLQPLAGQSLLTHSLRTIALLNTTTTVVVVGHGAEQVRAVMSDHSVRFALQSPQNGTGHATAVGLESIEGDGIVLIVTGDTPLIRSETLAALVTQAGPNSLALLTCTVTDATGYGRIVRNASGKVERIVEHTDALAAQDAATLAIREINTGIMAAPTAWLRRALSKLTPKNVQGELYLTDIIAQAVIDDLHINTAQPVDEVEVAGVNDKVQLVALERIYQAEQAKVLLAAGVTLADSARIDVRGTLHCGSDVFIDVGCVFEGAVVLDDGVHVGPNCVIRNAQIASGAIIHAMSHLEDCIVGPGARVGPFARLRPGAELGAEVHIGNFVEIKNSSLAAGAKANHLAYLGDATVGERVNFGAGSITANYDGVNKHKTIIEADVHVGSNCVLVAPITLGVGGTVAGGSTLTKNTEPGALSIGRSKQIAIANWKRPDKKAK